MNVRYKKRIEVQPNKSIYFASDFHLGAPSYEASRLREDRIIRWLDSIKQDAHELFLMGDVFDFWFEYKRVVPKGFIRFLGKLAELTDAGITVNIFQGNHDRWMFDYLAKELGIAIIPNELVMQCLGCKFYLHHGDGIGEGDHSYKMLKKIFTNKLCQRVFSWLHPDFGIKLAQAWSAKRRARYLPPDELRKAQDPLIQYCRDILQKEHHDYFVFGHKHLPLDVFLGSSRYINLGEWINYNSYAVFNKQGLQLKYFEKS